MHGVQVAYMQLDDWWYQGKFFFGNVKAITDWYNGFDINDSSI